MTYAYKMCGLPFDSDAAGAVGTRALIIVRFFVVVGVALLFNFSSALLIQFKEIFSSFFVLVILLSFYTENMKIVWSAIAHTHFAQSLARSFAHTQRTYQAHREIINNLSIGT